MRLESLLHLLSPNTSNQPKTLYHQWIINPLESLANKVKNGYGQMRYYYKKEDDVYELLAKFEGEWKNNMVHGNGVLYDKNQERLFEGVFHSGIFLRGFGSFFHCNGKKEFQGDILDGKKHGKGIEFNRRGRKIFEGNFLFGKRHGKGIEFYFMGQKEKEGTWDHGNFVEGTHFRYHMNGNLEYEGQVDLSDRPHGQGTTLGADGIIEYSGEYKRGKKWGHGTMYRKGVLQYIGNFKNDKPHGSGVLFYHTMVPCFEGKFVNNEIYGNGKLYYSSGNLHKTGFFKFGKLSGKGCTYDKDGTTLLEKGKFVNDQLVDEHLFSIQKFLETKDEQFVSKVPKDYLKKYIFEKYTTKVASNKNKSYMVAFLNELSQNKKQKEAPTEEDLFGNVISNPCRGSDGGIYDLESMNYLFEKKPDGDYKNIPYTYNEQNQRVPSFPRMSNGDRLTSFVILDEN